MFKFLQALLSFISTIIRNLKFKHRLLLLVFLLSLVLFTTISLQAQTNSPNASYPQNDPQSSKVFKPPVLLGLYTNGYAGEQQIIDRELRQVEQSAEKKHSIVGIFVDIQDNNHDYNIGHRLELLRENGYTAFINLKATHKASEIARGDLDNDIRRVAKAVADWTNKGNGRMMFIAPLQEMNITGETYSLDPENFKLSYKRIQEIFTEFEISSNSVLWVFSPNGFSRNHNDAFENYYPNNAQVDIVGFSSYNWGYCPNPLNQSKRWGSPALAYAPYIARMQKLAPNKPIFITQIASSSYIDPQISNQIAKDNWLYDTYRYLALSKTVQAIIYFNIQKECDWALNFENRNVNRNYKEGIANPMFDYIEPQNMSQFFRSPI